MNLFLLRISLTRRASVKYDDHGDWPVLADGYGSSLELVCQKAAVQNSATAWAASPVPGSIACSSLSG